MTLQSDNFDEPTCFYSTFVLDQTESMSPSSARAQTLSSTQHHSSVFPTVFNHYLRLYNQSETHTGSEDEEDSLIQMLEDLSELVRILTPNGTAFTPNDDATIVLPWSLHDSTLLFLFLTVLRAIEISRLLLPDQAQSGSLDLSAVSEESLLVDMSSTKALSWQDLNMLTPHTNMTDLASETNTVFNQLTTATPLNRQPRAMILGRLDMVLFDFSRFERRFSQLLLMTEGDHVEQDMRAGLTQQNEQCLSSLRLLHSQIHDLLHYTIQERQ